MRARSAANSADSSPPSPDFTSSTTSSASCGSRGARRSASCVLEFVRRLPRARRTSAANDSSSARQLPGGLQVPASGLELAVGRHDGRQICANRRPTLRAAARIGVQFGVGQLTFEGGVFGQQRRQSRARSPSRHPPSPKRTLLICSLNAKRRPACARAADRAVRTRGADRAVRTRGADRAVRTRGADWASVRQLFVG